MSLKVYRLVFTSVCLLASQCAFAAFTAGKGGGTTSGSDHWGTTYSGGACIGDSSSGKSGSGITFVDNGCVPAVASVDDDGDSMPSTWELIYNLNKYNSQDRFMDVDGDGSTNAREYVQGTEASGTGSSDTDDDGSLDGEDPNPISAGSGTFNLDATYKGVNVQNTIDAN